MQYASNRNRTLWIGLGVLALLALFAWGGGMWGHGFEGGYGFRPFGPFGFGVAPWFFGIGFLIRVVIWGAILYFIVSLFRRRAYSMHDHDEVSHAELSPVEILNRRYAAGEITREQYDEMRRVLEEHA